MFKIRCSAIGKIMSNPRTKKAQEAGELSETAKTYCQEWMKEQIYGYSKIIDSRPIQRGIELEEDALEMLSDLHNTLYIKNEISKENEYLTGTCDILTANYIRDVKVSKDCFTFPLFEKTLPTKNYYWQMQGYMALYNKDVAYVDYVLLDDEEGFINGVPMIYDCDVKYLVKSFKVTRNDEDIERIYKRVKESRQYIENEKKSLIP